MSVSENTPEWLLQCIRHLTLTATGDALTAEEMAHRIHEALEICEAEKYATPESRFEFVLSGANEQDLASIRACLTPFENLIVDIRGQ